MHPAYHIIIHHRMFISTHLPIPRRKLFTCPRVFRYSDITVIRICAGDDFRVQFRVSTVRTRISLPLVGLGKLFCYGPSFFRLNFSREAEKAVHSVNFIRRCQPDSGFRGSPAIMYRMQRCARTPYNAHTRAHNDSERMYAYCTLAYRMTEYTSYTSSFVYLHTFFAEWRNVRRKSPSRTCRCKRVWPR